MVDAVMCGIRLGPPLRTLQMVHCFQRMYRTSIRSTSTRALSEERQLLLRVNIKGLVFKPQINWEEGELYMLTIQPGEIELEERWYESDPTMRFQIALLFNAETGNKDSAVGYFEVEPGNALPTHADSAEEVLLCLEGMVEVTLGNERSQMSAGDMTLVPAMVPHALRNRGAEMARIVGFFSRVVVESTFEQPLMPSGQRVFSTPSPEEVVDT